MAGKMAELAAPRAHPSREMAKNQAYTRSRKKQLENGSKTFYMLFPHPLPRSMVVLKLAAYVPNVGYGPRSERRRAELICK